MNNDDLNLNGLNVTKRNGALKRSLATKTPHHNGLSRMKAHARRALFLSSAAILPMVFAQAASAQNYQPVLPTESCTVTYAGWLVDGGAGPLEDRNYTHNQAFAKAGWAADGNKVWRRAVSSTPIHPLSDFIAPNSFPEDTEARTFGLIPPNTAFGDLATENDTTIVETVLLITKVTATGSDTRDVTINDNAGLEHQTFAAFDASGNRISNIIRTNGFTSTTGTYTLNVNVPASGEFYVYVWKVDIDQGSGTGIAECGADLVTTKVNTGASVVSVGDTVTFDIEVENLGPEEARNVRLTDLVPPGLTPTSVNGTTSLGSYNSGTGEWTFTALANGATATLTIEGVVDASAVADSVENITTAAISDQAPLTEDGDDLSESVDIKPIANADESLGNTAGTDVTFNVLTNDQNPSLIDISTVALVPPANATNIVRDADNRIIGFDVPDQGSWSVDASGNLTFEPLDETVITPTPISYTVEATNGAVSEPATATVTYAPLDVDLSLTKTNTPGVNAEVDQADDTLTSGDSTTYTVVITNNGPDAVTGAVVTDSIVEGLTCAATNAVTLTGDGVPAGSFTIGDLIGAGITLETLEDGESTSLTYTCEVN